MRCAWDASARVWRFPISEHDRVLEALQRTKGVRLHVEPLHNVPMTVIQVGDRVTVGGRRLGCQASEGCEAGEHG